MPAEGGRTQRHLDYEQDHHDERALMMATLGADTGPHEPRRPTAPDEDNSPARLTHEVNMLLSSVASHGPAALTDTTDPQYTARLLRRLRDCITPTSAQALAAADAVRAEMARNGLDVHRKVYGMDIANVIARAALDASLRTAAGGKGSRP